MKNSLLFFILMVGSIQVKAEAILQCMQRVNKEVLVQKDIPNEWMKRQISIEDFNSAIQLHLKNVISVLRARSPQPYSSTAYHERLRLLDELENYAVAGIFPKNEYATYKTPVFIDHYSTHCAVGYLMQQSGAEDLAREIAFKQNLAYVRDIRVIGVKEWAHQHGFSIDELAWIQPGYPPTTIVSPLLGGVNGRVNAILSFQGEVIAAGEFSQADGMPASNIASYISGFAGFLWTETAGGTNGPIYALDTINNHVLAAGAFTQAGTSSVNSIAVLTESGWANMGSGISGTIYDLEWHEGTLYAGGNFTFDGGSNLAFWDGVAWQGLGWSPNGSVRCLKSTSDGLIYGGEFTQSGVVSTLHIGKVFGGQAESIGNGIPTIIYDVENWNNRPTAAGAFKENGNVFGLMQFDGNTWASLQGMAQIAQLDTTGVIFTMELLSNELIAGGNFNQYDLMTFGKHLMKWNTPTAFPIPIAVFDSSVYCLKSEFDYLYAGGEFTEHLGTSMNHIATLSSILSIEIPASNTSQLKAWPVPSSGSVSIRYTGKSTIGKLYDLQGKLIEMIQLNGDTTVHLPTSGIYFLITEKGDRIKLMRE
ncbi:MAG: hypothetical protein RLZZ543_1482 [Bacteroidota bacterium]